MYERSILLRNLLLVKVVRSIGESSAKQFVNLPMETFPLSLRFLQSHVAMLVYDRCISCAHCAFPLMCAIFYPLCWCSRFHGIKGVYKCALCTRDRLPACRLACTDLCVRTKLSTRRYTCALICERYAAGMHVLTSSRHSRWSFAHRQRPASQQGRHGQHSLHGMDRTRRPRRTWPDWADVRWECV